MLNITNYQGNENQNHNETLIPVRMTVIKKTTVGKDVKKRESLCTAKCKLVQPLWNTVESSLKNCK